MESESWKVAAGAVGSDSRGRWSSATRGLRGGKQLAVRIVVSRDPRWTPREPRNGTAKPWEAAVDAVGSTFCASERPDDSVYTEMRVSSNFKVCRRPNACGWGPSREGRASCACKLAAVGRSRRDRVLGGCVEMMVLEAGNSAVRARAGDERVSSSVVCRYPRSIRDTFRGEGAQVYLQTVRSRVRADCGSLWGLRSPRDAR